MGTGQLFVSLLAGSLALASGTAIPSPKNQKPLAAPKPDFAPLKPQRSWDAAPGDDNYDNQIFFRLATLLQHWPNTRYPSGSSVVPGTIPIGTTLYHGRSVAEVPSKPDWLAFDAEHSAMFARGPNSRLFTFMTTRPLRVLYFDGSSAAKLSSGSTDTQDLLAWSRVGNSPIGEERARIADLCEWGRPFGIDGFVRMEMSFEIMHCDFYQGLEVVSSHHLLPTEDNEPGRGPGRGPGRPSPPSPNDPSAPPPPPFDFFAGSNPPAPAPVPTQTGVPRRPHFPSEPRPPNWKGPLVGSGQRGFESFQAGAWHHRAPGEVRVRIDAARLVSLYDPVLQSGVAIRKGLEKILHRGKGLSAEDIATWRGWIVGVVQPDAPATSGVDWQALTTVIMDRYGGRLEYLRMLLQPDYSAQNATAAVQDVRAHLLIMLTPDITADTIPINATRTGSSPAAQYSQARRREANDFEWVKPIADHCSSFLVSHLPRDKFTREERTLYAGVSGTLHEICRVLSLLWSQAYDPSPVVQPAELLEGWRKQVDGLMQWLDWPMWNRCIPECGIESLCFIPTWPMGIGSGPGEKKGELDLTKIDWTPKCIPRVKQWPVL